MVDKLEFCLDTVHEILIHFQVILYVLLLVPDLNLLHLETIIDLPDLLLYHFILL